MKKAMGFVSAVFATALMVSACGTTPGERAVSGGVLGAGAGAAVGSLYGHAGTGAIIGGVGGAAVGLATTPPPPPRYGYSRYGSNYGCVDYSYYYQRCMRYGYY